jgi:hypothetical protein
MRVHPLGRLDAVARPRTTVFLPRPLQRYMIDPVWYRVSCWRKRCNICGELIGSASSTTSGINDRARSDSVAGIVERTMRGFSDLVQDKMINPDYQGINERQPLPRFPVTGRGLFPSAFCMSSSKQNPHPVAFPEWGFYFGGPVLPCAFGAGIGKRGIENLESRILYP